MKQHDGLIRDGFEGLGFIDIGLTLGNTRLIVRNLTDGRGVALLKVFPPILLGSFCQALLVTPKMGLRWDTLLSSARGSHRILLDASLFFWHNSKSFLVFSSDSKFSLVLESAAAL